MQNWTNYETHIGKKWGYVAKTPHGSASYDNNAVPIVMPLTASQPVITTSELLRQRSNLRPVTTRRGTDNRDIDRDSDEDDTLSVSAQSSSATDDHLRLLREALDRIKKSSGTDTDDDNDDNGDSDFMD